MDMRLRMNEIANILANSEQLINLKFRWLDEKEYEDFNDYIVFIKKLFPSLNITKVTKSFSITIIEDKTEYVFKINSNCIRSFARVA